MGVFSAMLETRRLGYEERLPRIMKTYGSLDLAALTRERDSYAAELERIEGRGEAMALADRNELALLVRIQRVKATIDELAGSRDISEYESKYELFSGLLLWQISTDYKPRLWRAKKAIKLLDNAIAEAQSREQSLRSVQKRARRGFEGYAKRIATLGQRISRLQVEVDRVAGAHRAYLQELAAATLERQKNRLRTYITQARFGIAQIYDRSLSRAEMAQ